jgi:hypothetical protein
MPQHSPRPRPTRACLADGQPSTAISLIEAIYYGKLVRGYWRRRKNDQIFSRVINQKISNFLAPEVTVLPLGGYQITNYHYINCKNSVYRVHIQISAWGK